MHTVADQSGERLDVFLARIYPDHSRSYWQKLCEQGNVQVNDSPAPSKTLLKMGDSVEVAQQNLPDFRAHTLPVLYEDAGVIVLNKPAGILTHAKGALSYEFSVGEYMRSRTTADAATNRPGIVHRLDRGTSGVIIAAKTSEAKRWLQAQFSKRNVKKTYLALVSGHLKEPHALLQLPIERNPKKPHTFRVGGNGKPAETAYRVVREFSDCTLVELQPTTGRTHQLRVHMAYLGHPIVGDELYGRSNPRLGRMFLHAATLELTLPSRERKVFQAPLPPELQHYLDALQ